MQHTAIEHIDACPHSKRVCVACNGALSHAVNDALQSLALLRSVRRLWDDKDLLSVIRGPSYVDGVFKQVEDHLTKHRKKEEP